MSGEYARAQRRDFILLVGLIESEDGRTFRERGCRGQEGGENCLVMISREDLAPLVRAQVTRKLTLLLCVSISVVETPNLRSKRAQIGLGRVVLPGTPICRPSDFATKSTHPSVSICINNATTGHNAICAL